MRWLPLIAGLGAAGVVLFALKSVAKAGGMPSWRGSTPDNPLPPPAPGGETYYNVTEPFYIETSGGIMMIEPVAPGADVTCVDDPGGLPVCASAVYGGSASMSLSGGTPVAFAPTAMRVVDMKTPGISGFERWAALYNAQQDED